MKKEILSEIDQMKYLFVYKPGRVISEQEKPIEVVSEQFIEYVKGEDKEKIFSTKDKEFIDLSKNPNRWNNLYRMIGMQYRTDKKTQKSAVGYVDRDGKFVEGYSKEAGKLVEKMTDKMDETSIQVFNEMAQKNPLFYAYILRKYEVLSIPGNFPKAKRHIIVDNVTTVKQAPPPTQTEGTEVIEPGVKIQTNVDFVQPNFFAYNEATLTPQFQQFINENIISVLDEAKNQLKEFGGTSRGVLDSLIIKASSSKLRNGQSKTVANDGTNCSINPATKKPYEACPTHLTLSKARAEAAKNYIVNELKKNNVEVDENKIVLQYAGENGDGTSGPEFTQSDNPKDEKYLKAQRVDIDAVIAIRTQMDVKKRITPPEIKQAEPTAENDYRVTISGRERGGFQMSIPSFDFSRKQEWGGGMDRRTAKVALQKVKCRKP